MTVKMGMWREHLVGTATGVTLTLTSEAVPSGERRYLSIVSVETDTTATSDVDCYMHTRGRKIPLYNVVNIGTALAKSRTMEFWMTEGEYTSFEFSGIVAGEVCEVGIFGHIQYRERK